ncbi:MAG: TrmO family methyltransferase domain-containing protein [Nocardioidaceae bacterium]
MVLGTMGATTNLVLRPIGGVEGGRDGVYEDGWAVEAWIVVDPGTSAWTRPVGLEAFSHIDVVYTFHRVTEVSVGTRHPRGDPRWPKVGILADHSPMRLNHLGIPHCALLSVDDAALRVRGLDGLARSPLLDVKQWYAEFGPLGPVR